MEEALRRFNWSQSGTGSVPFRVSFVQRIVRSIDTSWSLTNFRSLLLWRSRKGERLVGAREDRRKSCLQVGRFHSWIPHRCRGTIGGKTRTSDVIASRCLASDWLADSITCQCIATDSRMREPRSDRTVLSFVPSFFTFDLLRSFPLAPFLPFPPHFPSATLRSTPTATLPRSPLLLLPSSGYHMTNVSWLLFRYPRCSIREISRPISHSLFFSFFISSVFLRCSICFLALSIQISIPHVFTSNETFITRSRAISLPIQSILRVLFSLIRFYASIRDFPPFRFEELLIKF